MESKTIGAAEFRDAQHQQWDKAATGWRKWSELIDTAASHVSDRMVELAGITAGSRAVDVAAGYGEPSLSAARVAGPNGKVVATDISAEMLGYGRERAEAEGLENIEFVQSDAISLDFPAGSFDAALSRFGIIFDPDGEGAAAAYGASCSRAAACRSPRGERRTACLSWASRCAPRCSTSGPRRPRRAPRARCRGRRRRRSAACSRAAASPRSRSRTWRSASRSTPPTSSRSSSGRSRRRSSAIFAPHPQDVQEAGWAAITAAMAEQAGSDGTVELKNQVLIATGSA